MDVLKKIFSRFFFFGDFFPEAAKRRAVLTLHIKLVPVDLPYSMGYVVVAEFQEGINWPIAQTFASALVASMNRAELGDTTLMEILVERNVLSVICANTTGEKPLPLMAEFRVNGPNKTAFLVSTADPDLKILVAHQLWADNLGKTLGYQLGIPNSSALENGRYTVTWEAI